MIWNPWRSENRASFIKHSSTLILPRHFNQPNKDREPTTCPIRVSCPGDVVPDQHAMRSLRDIKESPKMTDKLRQRWVEEIVKIFSSSPNPISTIRPWDILLHQDGSVEALSSEKEGRSFYPSRFRIPPLTVLGLDEGEKVKRAERFALGSLLYELMTANEPFQELSDDEVQDHYGRGIFPDDVFAMAMGPYILGCWSLEFEKEMEKIRELFSVGCPSVADALFSSASTHG